MYQISLMESVHQALTQNVELFVFLDPLIGDVRFGDEQRLVFQLFEARDQLLVVPEVDFRFLYLF